MSGPKSRQSLENLGKALDRLAEALEETEESDSLAVDGTIQRFEFVLELYWKTLKRLLADEGIQAGTPREVLQQAYQVRWIEDETAWLQMLEDRNKTSHTYDEKEARKIYKSIRQYFPEMKKVYTLLRAKND